MPNKYPFYDLTEGENLEQGDILIHCPVIVPVMDSALLQPDTTIIADRVWYDVIIMTQSCDLANDKVTDVILCQHYSLMMASETNPSFTNKKIYEQILSGNRPRYSMLAASDVTDFPMDIRVVDFGRIFSLPKGFVRQFATQQGRRLRLCPPYREHLSQSFARFFMRVGLPQNIELPK